MTEKGGLKAILVVLLALLTVSLLAFYWLMPFNFMEFATNPGNNNFSLNSSLSSQMQFYPNLRYSYSDISYKIDSDSCTIKKQDDMRRALDAIENITTLSFYPVSSSPDIDITCEDTVVIEENYFVAGEGGPVNITKSGALNIINEGKILLLKESNCENPNIAIHELLHALGFNHSDNRNNIMYPVTKCSETIGEDIPALIDEIYSIPPYSDLLFGEVSAVVNGRYLDTNITILNNGLIKSGNAQMIISGGGDEINQQTISPLEAGSGITFYFGNIRMENLDISELEYRLETGFNEIDDSNNLVVLKIKK